MKMNYNKMQYENTIYVSRETYMSLQLSRIEHTSPKGLLEQSPNTENFIYVHVPQQDRGFAS